MKRVAVAISLMVFLLCVVAPSAGAITMTKPERRVLTLINRTRANHKLHRLRMSASLERASRSHSREMGKDGYFSHTSYNGESFSARIIRFGYTYKGCTCWKVGEDIAYGSGGTSGSATAIFKAWMKSPAHKAIILTKAFRRVGIGRATGSFDGIDGVVFFTLDAGVRR